MQLNSNFLTIIVIFLTTTFLSAQNNSRITLQRAEISPFGNSVMTDGLYLSHTAGQASGYTQENNAKIELRQGFEQALIFTNESNSQTVNIIVYPNPNNGSFYLSTDLSRGMVYTLTVYDNLGKILYINQGQGGEESFFTLPQGVTTGSYPISIKTENGLKAEAKLIVL